MGFLVLPTDPSNDKNTSRTLASRPNGACRNKILRVMLKFFKTTRTISQWLPVQHGLSWLNAVLPGVDTVVDPVVDPIGLVSKHTGAEIRDIVNKALHIKGVQIIINEEGPIHIHSSEEPAKCINWKFSHLQSLKEQFTHITSAVTYWLWNYIDVPCKWSKGSLNGCILRNHLVS